MTSRIASTLAGIKQGLTARSRAHPAGMIGIAAFTLACLGLFWWLGPLTRNVLFREGRTLDWLSSTYLASAAVGFSVAFVRALRRAEARSWTWLLAASGFIFLAFDERFQLHERFGRGDVGGPFGLRNLGDGLLILYGAVAVIAGLIAFQTVVRCPSARFMVLGFSFYIAHTLADTLMDSSGTKLRLEESFKLLSSAHFAMAGLVAAYRYRNSPPEGGRAGFGPVGHGWLMAVNIGLAVFVGTVGPGWNESAPSPWGHPATWLASVYLGSAALYSWTAGRPLRDSQPWTGWLAWRQLALVLSVAAALFGVPAWRSIAKQTQDTFLFPIYQVLLPWFWIPLFWGGLAALAAALLLTHGGVRPSRPFQILLALGVGLLAVEVGLGLAAQADSLLAPLLRMVGCGCILSAVLHQLFESEHEWNHGSVGANRL